VSCSVHDVIRLERRGVPCVAVATRPFIDEAVEQADSLGMPEIAVVYIPHPVQLLEPSDLQALADQAFPAVLDGLTGSR
jgi:hypothetical protein